MTKCANCQSNMAESAKFCPYCGTPVTREVALGASGISQDAAPPSPIKVEPEGTPKRTGKLIIYAMLLAVAGGLLILVVAPEFQGRYGSRLFGYVYFQTVESWAALIGGGVCLLLAGLFLLRALSEK